VALTVELVAADRTVWSGEAASVLARTLDGEIGILAGHSPLLGILAPGEVKVVPAEGGEGVSAEVDGGFLSVENDRVLVVAEGVRIGEAAASSRRSH
jgi:F-type H+-transporting ATPase subunit epsilon